jgi:hypothetical protein
MYSWIFTGVGTSSIWPRSASKNCSKTPTPMSEFCVFVPNANSGPPNSNRRNIPKGGSREISPSTWGRLAKCFSSVSSCLQPLKPTTYNGTSRLSPISFVLDAYSLYKLATRRRFAARSGASEAIFSADSRTAVASRSKICLSPWRRTVLICAVFAATSDHCLVRSLLISMHAATPSDRYSLGPPY